MRILLTGGAGYVGSHVAMVLAEAGHQPVIYDNLSTGHRRAVVGFPLVQADVGDRETMLRALREHRIEAVMHFAALIQVGESVRQPARYYENNLLKPLLMLEAMREALARGDAPRNHDNPRRCAACGYREYCEQALV